MVPRVAEVTKIETSLQNKPPDVGNDNVGEGLGKLDDATAPAKVDPLTYAPHTCLDRLDFSYANENAFLNHKNVLFNNDFGDNVNANPNNKDSKVEISLCKMITVSSDLGPPHG